MSYGSPMSPPNGQMMAQPWPIGPSTPSPEMPEFRERVQTAPTILRRQQHRQQQQQQSQVQKMNAENNNTEGIYYLNNF